MGNYPGALPSLTPATHTEVAEEVRAIASELDATKALTPVATRVRLSVDQSIASTVTMTNITGLSWSVAATEEWDFELVLHYEGAAAADVQVQFIGPAGASIWYGVVGPQTAATTNISHTPIQAAVAAFATPTTLGSIGTGSRLVARFAGVVKVNATGGTVQAQFRQNVSDAVATKILTGTLLTAVKV